MKKDSLNQDEAAVRQPGPFKGTTLRRRGGPICLRLLRSRFRSHSPDVRITLIYLAAGLAIISIGLGSLMHLPQVPYNLRELFGEHDPLLSLPLFAAFLIWTAAAPNILARITIICPLLHLAQPLFFLILALPSWLLLQGAVSAESLEDVLGARTLGWPGDLELFIRFLALVMPLLLTLFYWNLMLEGTASLRRHFGIGQLLMAMLIGLPLFWLSKQIVIDRAATDHIRELMVGHGSWRSIITLTLVVGLVTLNGVLLVWFRLCSRHNRVIIPLASPLFLLASWWLLNLALYPQALVFLLGPDEHYKASQTTLALRWAMVYGSAVGLIAFAHLIPFRLRGPVGLQRRALETGTFPHAPRAHARSAPVLTRSDLPDNA